MEGVTEATAEFLQIPKNVVRQTFVCVFPLSSVSANNESRRPFTASADRLLLYGGDGGGGWAAGWRLAGGGDSRPAATQAAPPAENNRAAPGRSLLHRIHQRGLMADVIPPRPFASCRKK